MTELRYQQALANLLQVWLSDAWSLSGLLSRWERVAWRKAGEGRL